MSLIKYLSTAVIILLIVGVAPLGPTGMPRLHGVFATTHNLSLIGNLNGWNFTKPGPPITALQGDTINIQFTQPDTTHRFYVDVDKNQIPDCPTPDKCGPSYSTPTSFTFTVDFGPGSYKYYCSIHPSMVGPFDVPSPDFSITPAPSSMTLIQGSSQTSTITVSSLNSFSGIVSLSASVSPSGLTPSLSPTSVTLSSGGSASSTLTVSSSTPGSYTVNVTGTSGLLSHSTTVTVSVVAPDFSISPSPASLTINQGLSKTSTLTVSSLNGFSGTVTFSSPSTPLGITAALSKSSVPVTPSTPGTITLNVTVGSSTTPGQYTVSVTGSVGGNTHTANVAVIVVSLDFAISLAQSSVTILQGSSGNAIITLNSENGFVGSVSLTATVSPSGPSLSFNPAMLSLTSGSSATSTLSIATASGFYSSTATGNYTVTVTATGSPSLSHSATLTARVTSQSSSPAASNIPVSVLVIAGVAILAIVVVVAYAFLRRKPGK